MKRVLITFIFVILCAIVVKAQSGIIKGMVVNADTKTGLANVNITVSVNKYSTITNYKGSFSIGNIESGNYTLTFSMVGFKSVTKEVAVATSIVDMGSIELYPVPVNLGEITVSSTKFDKQLKDVSIPMVVLTNDDFKTKNTTTLVELLKNEPGLNLGRDGIWGTRLNIRGFSKEAVVTLIDGNRVETANNIAASLSLVDPSAIERVEVIKGSASSLYGTGAVGGVINIITNKNLFAGDFNYGGSYNSGYNSVNKSISNTLSLNAGSYNWFAKVTGTYRNAKDTETPMGTLKDSRFKDNSIFATIGFRPFDNHEFILDYQLFNAKDVGIPGGASLPSTASARYPDEKRELYSFDYKAYNLLNNLATLEFKVFYQFIARNVEVIPNATTIMNPRADHYTTGALLQSNWIFGDNHLVIGIDAWQRRYQGSRERYLSNVKRTIYDKPIPDSKYRSIGVFAQDEFKALDDNLTLTIGGRIDQINVTNDAVSNPIYMINNGNYNYNPPKTPGASFVEGDK
ncbi:MAG TPA: TonB-dependent receptor plug domain-containing protein, partial [Melioribacteraceae bacterium]|nr:TonB-dependent receptor plug domain-containing protein [Melioribacteraceae bacterium]